MTDLQKKELNLLTHFTHVCRALDLTWYLVCGSALGAVKYGGFIPWDDDVDVALPRKDYDRFVENAPGLLPPEFFVQTHKTDPHFPKAFCKLRDSGTTYIELAYRQLPIHHGVFIDIFPLDGYPTDQKAQARFQRRLRAALRQTSCALDLPRSLKGKLLCKGLRLLGCHKRTAPAVDKLETMLRSCPAEQAELWCNCGNFRGTLQPLPRAVYGDGVEMTFEGLPVRVPAQYDRYLRQLYGDYHRDPPPEEQVGHHYYAAMDLEQPCPGRDHP